MRIILATSSFNGGGISSYAHELINAYSFDNDVSMIIGDDSRCPILQKGISVYKYSCEDLSIKNAKAVLSLILQIEPDVIINSNAKLISLLTPCLPSKIRVISVAHSLKFQEVSISCYNAKYADNIIALSQSCKAYILANYKLRQESISVVYNFVNPLSNSDEIRRTKITNDPISIVYSGGTAPSKSPEIVICLLNLLLKTDLNFKFYWLGSLTPPFKKIQPFNSIEDVIKADSRVCFLGKVPRKQAEQIIANANVFLAPSRREGCPMALLEGMRVGTISVVADYDIANKEILTHTFDGYIIDHKNVNEFVDVLKKIILNHEQFTCIYENSVNTFNEKLSFPAWKEKMDLIIYAPKDFQLRRKKYFSVPMYIWQRLLLNVRVKYDRFALIILEYLPCAVKIFSEYLKYKVFNKITKY